MFWIQDLSGNFIDAEKVEAFCIMKKPKCTYYYIEARTEGRSYEIRNLLDLQYTINGRYCEKMAEIGLREFMQELYEQGFGKQE